MADSRDISLSAAQSRKKTWPWAAGSILATLLVLVATLVGRQIAANRRAAGYLVAGPPLPTLSVLGATPANRALRLATLDPATGDILALTSAPTRDCPPGVSCVASPTPDTLAVYDGATGQQLATRALVPNDPLTYAQFLVIDGARHVAYAIAPPGEGTTAMLFRLSPTTGAAIGALALPSAVSTDLAGAALVSTTGNLALVSGSRLMLLDPGSGVILTQQSIATADAAPSVDGPVVDATGATIALVLRDGFGARLRMFSATTLRPLATHALPTGSRLGDYDPTDGAFALIGAHGDVSTLSAGDLASDAAAKALSDVSGARAVAWEGARNRLIVAHASDVTAYDVGAGRAIAALPIAFAASDAAAPASRSLFTGTQDGRLYIRDVTGMLIIARDVEATRRAGDPGTALLLARSAMARYLPKPKQSPPFVAASSFPVAAGTRQRDYYISFSDRGWQAFPGGSIASAVSATARDGAAYQVTFMISWYQLFPHTHTWVCLVTPDGSVRLSAESGDALP